MSNTTNRQRPDAPHGQPIFPADRNLGTHRMDDSDESFEALPDLTTGRTLADTIAYLDWVASAGSEGYGKAWTDEMRDIGVSVMCENTSDGLMIQVSHPCGGQLFLRRERSDAIIAHFKAVDGGRAAILAHLKKHGSAFGYKFKVTK